MASDVTVSVTSMANRGRSRGAGVMSRCRVLQLERVNPVIQSPETGSVPCVYQEEPQPCRRVRTVSELQEEEKRNILLALEAADWRVAGEEGAAKMLGISRNTLRKKLEQYSIS